MSRRVRAAAPSPLALEPFQPRPGVLYSLEAAAHLSGASRRAILVYCRAGLVQPVLLPPYGVMVFTEEAIHAVRRIEQLRTVHGLELRWIKVLLALADEVERLRAEVRFWRDG